MKKSKLVFVSRKPSDSVSIERVFNQIAKDLPADRFDLEVQNVPYGNSAFGILMNLLFFRPEPADVYHITGQIHYITLRLPKNKTLLTVHDLIFLHRRKGIRHYLLKKLFLDLPLKKLDLVTAISTATKDEIVQQTKCDPSKIRVIENPLSDGFEAEPVKPFDEKCPVILQIGTGANKNVPTLIRALNSVSCKLRIIGRLDANINQALAETDTRFENAPYVDEKEMVEEYRKADIVAFCSVYEGFGLPIIEAQAMQKPVITSNVSPMRDVAGHGAHLSNPNDVASIKSGVLKIIREPDHRRELVNNGIENVRRFDGRKLAMKYVEAYNELMKG